MTPAPDSHDVYAPPTAAIVRETIIVSPRRRFWLACLASALVAPAVIFLPADSWGQLVAMVAWWAAATFWVVRGDAMRFPRGGIGRWLFLALGLGIGMALFAAGGSLVAFGLVMAAASL